MLSGCWTFVLLLLPAVSRAQSGDGDVDTEPRISCTSDIMTYRSSLTCKLVGGRTDNEDDEDQADGIEKMTVCYNDMKGQKVKTKCVKDFGDTVSSSDLNPVMNLNVTVYFKSGGNVMTMIDLKKIIKPRSPQVWNVTFDESNQAVIHIQIPYHKEFLKDTNQLFQLFIWSAGSSTVQNISQLFLKIDMDHFKKNSEYHVKVRAIPQRHLEGTWSDRRDNYTLIVCLILLLVMPTTVVFFWKNKIFTYMWPSIPHPKHTLVQICKPNKGLLLNFKPEVFSALRVYPMQKAEEQPCEEAEPSITAAAEGSQSNHASSTQSSDCSRSTTSVSTEELELSALLSRSSSDGEDSLQSTSPSPIDVLQLGERPHTPGGNEAEGFGVNQQEEAYVTMSSFYQIK
ncbi:Interleukin-7 receptor subunit alpha [Nibea albiflora]|uniref:Interleukin-7 receptor subunit alpha n=1 Tax=Nibea albiflora TaxID=240163 RepID=A0ACB7FBH7_NIBAL|nr:Interleukin-7 receptor subunit alpha [Nibea albiflora]